MSKVIWLRGADTKKHAFVDKYATSALCGKQREAKNWIILRHRTKKCPRCMKIMKDYDNCGGTE